MQISFPDGNFVVYFSVSETEQMAVLVESALRGNGAKEYSIPHDPDLGGHPLAYRDRRDRGGVVLTCRAPLPPHLRRDGSPAGDEEAQ